MEIETLITGQMAENCYLIKNDQEMLIVDPGDDSSHILREIAKSKQTPVAILLTHGHIDHILGLPDILKVYNLPVYLSEKEKTWLNDPFYNLSQFFGTPFSLKKETIPYETSMTLGNFSFTTLRTPGHSIGGTTFYFPKENLAIVGDTLFSDSIGRTDFPTGDYGTLINSIQEKLFTLPKETVIYPGHGEKTTILKEMTHNPFVGGN